jgi:hypothetical protein
LAQEADTVLGEGLHPTDHRMIEELEYCEAVIRESMRLKTVGPLLTLEPLADTTICDTHIPAGTRLLLLLRHAGLHDGEHASEFFRHEPDSMRTAGTRKVGSIRSRAYMRIPSIMAWGTPLARGRAVHEHGRGCGAVGRTTQLRSVAANAPEPERSGLWFRLVAVPALRGPHGLMKMGDDLVVACDADLCLVL